LPTSFEMSSVTDNKMGEVVDADAKIQAMTEIKEIRDAAIHAFHKAQQGSKVHHFEDSDKADHIKAWKVLKYAQEKVSYGTNYFMKVLIDEKEGHTIHIRVHRQEHHDKYDFYSLHENITHNHATYVWGVNEALVYFNY